jgi:muramoyltetrapeptide carboxypeptidase
LQRGCAVLQGFGLDVVVSEHVLDRSTDPPYLAGSDADRAADLHRAWLDPGIAAVVCARGGYGAMRLLDQLDWAALAQGEPKILLGGSDATALHQAFATHLGLATLFGPMPATAILDGTQPDQISLTALRTMLLDPDRARVLSSPRTRTLIGGRARGVSTGGTLSLLAAGVGSPEYRPASGGIVFVEDVAELPYRIDRMFTQLLRAGWFAGVQGIVAGTWAGCGTDEEIDRVLLDRLGFLDVPLLAGMDFGHGVPQLTVPLGIAAELDATAGTVVFTTPALQ